MSAAKPVFRPVFDWQSRAVLARHLRVHLRNWHTAVVPPLAEPLAMLLAFGVGLDGQIRELSWGGEPDHRRDDCEPLPRPLRPRGWLRETLLAGQPTWKLPCPR